MLTTSEGGGAVKVTAEINEDTGAGRVTVEFSAGATPHDVAVRAGAEVLTLLTGYQPVDYLTAAEARLLAGRDSEAS